MIRRVTIILLFLGSCTQKENKIRNFVTYKGFKSHPQSSVDISSVYLDSVLFTNGKYFYRLSGNIVSETNSTQNTFHLIFSENPLTTATPHVDHFSIPHSNVTNEEKWHCQFKKKFDFKNKSNKLQLKWFNGFQQISIELDPEIF